jgi:hypothetical protein
VAGDRTAVAAIIGALGSESARVDVRQLVRDFHHLGVPAGEVVQEANRIASALRMIDVTRRGLG